MEKKGLNNISTTTLAWAEPLELARALTHGRNSFVFLYSGLSNHYTGRYSYLALDPVQTMDSGGFSALNKHLPLPFTGEGSRASHESAISKAGEGRMLDTWFGYLGYGLSHELECLPTDAPSFITLPDMWLSRFATVVLFDHQHKTITVHGKPVTPARFAQQETSFSISDLASNMSKAEYLEKLRVILEAIHAGELYQINLTRKFNGEIQGDVTPFEIFARLAKASPSPMSALVQWDGNAIISSSPESFLKVDDGGRVTTRPIKGSARRSADRDADDALKQALLTSEKERAENLMIVDLMRNDLARGCEPGSVSLENLYEIMSYATVHHMVSTVSGQKRADISTLELVGQCFPPGSMTGTPKIRAMELAAELESMQRGVYSGALGWFGSDGSCDLSVVIRSIILQGNLFEFQVGGGIVADSDPESEWRETILKAKGICEALGISEQALIAI